MSKNASPAGYFLLLISAGLVVCGVVFGLHKVTGGSISLAGLFSPSAPQSPRVFPEGQLDFLDHVRDGLSAATLHTSARTYNLGRIETGHLINAVYEMHVRTDIGLLADDIPEGVIAETPAVLVCSLDFIAARAPRTFRVLLYKGDNGDTLAAIKREKNMIGHIYDGQYDAAAVYESLNEMTGGGCM